MANRILNTICILAAVVAFSVCPEPTTILSTVVVMVLGGLGAAAVVDMCGGKVIG